MKEHGEINDYEWQTKEKHLSAFTSYLYFSPQFITIFFFAVAKFVMVSVDLMIFLDYLTIRSIIFHKFNQDKSDRSLIRYFFSWMKPICNIYFLPILTITKIVTMTEKKIREKSINVYNGGGPYFRLTSFWRCLFLVNGKSVKITPVNYVFINILWL